MQCARHPGRVTYTRCGRCARPVCPECLTRLDAQTLCPECVDRALKSSSRPYGFASPRRRLRFGRLDAVYTTTIVLIGINLAVWLAILVTGGNASPVLRTLQLTPLGTCLLSDDPGRYLPGASPAQCAAAAGMTWSPGVATGAVWQVLTAAFTHVQVWHIGFNMMALFFLGPGLERAIGRAQFLALYFVSAVTSAAAIMWFSSPASSTVGASGAVFGLMGGLLILAWRRHGDARGVLTWLGLNLAFTFLNHGISWQGHIGGLLGGLAVAAIITDLPRRLGPLALRSRTSMQWLGIGLVALVAVGLIVARASLI